MEPAAPTTRVCAGSDHVNALQIDQGMDTFRPPHLQLKALLDMAGDPRCCVTTAVSGETLVGYVAFHPPTPPELWSLDRTGSLVELGAIEVAPSHRGKGLAERLLRLSFEGGRFDATIVFATMYVWHYDHVRSGLGDLGYRRVLSRLYGGAGFEQFRTSDPEIRSSPANALMARIGKDAPAAVKEEFDRLRLLNPLVTSV